jgi:trans-aconitate methyltransferase
MSTVGPGGADWDDIYIGDGTDTEPFARELLMDAGELPPGKALDLGCGAGGNTIGLAHRGWITTGLDSSAKAINSARITAAHAGVTATFLVTDITTWTPDDEYDLVVSLFALPPRGHARNAVLLRAQQALAPGGMLIVGEWERMDNRPEPYVGAEELTAALSDLDILRAEIVNADPEKDRQQAGSRLWPAVLITARHLA